MTIVCLLPLDIYSPCLFFQRFLLPRSTETNRPTSALMWWQQNSESRGRGQTCVVGTVSGEGWWQQLVTSPGESCSGGGELDTRCSAALWQKQWRMLFRLSVHHHHFLTLYMQLNSAHHRHSALRALTKSRTRQSGLTSCFYHHNYTDRKPSHHKVQALYDKWQPVFYFVSPLPAISQQYVHDQK